MISFEEVMEVTGPISSPTAFELPECKLLYDLLCTLRSDARIVEVGCQFGRSSSIILQAAPAGAELHFIDPFEDCEAAGGWLKQAWGFKRKLTLHMCKTAEVLVHLDGLDLVLIDGDHSEEGVWADCNTLLLWCNRGALACFHDYGRDSLPEVYSTVQRYMKDRPRWTFKESAGCLGVWRKL